MKSFLKNWTRTVAVLCAILVAVFLLSLEYRFGHAGWPISAGLSHGALWIGEINTPDRGAGWFVAPNNAVYVVWWSVPPWIARANPGIILPLWIPIVVSGLAAAIGLLQNRRTLPRGHCKCGYSLQGNQSGVCPECGRPTNPEVCQP